MAKVNFILPGNSTPQSTEARYGESLLDVAKRAGIGIEHTCGGTPSCGTCHVKVKIGLQGLSPAKEDERSILKYERGATADSRLACQAKVQEDVTVEVVNLSCRKAA